MGRKILNYSISLTLGLLLSFSLMAQNRNAATAPNNRAQKGAQKKEKEKKEEEAIYPLYNGTSVGVDLWGIGSKALGGDNLSTEVVIDVNLKHRYLPAVELGYGSTNTWNDQGIHYQSSAPYLRIGMDYNILYKKKHGNMLLVGLRYGVTSFKYDVESLDIKDPIYGGSIGNPNLEDGIWGGSLPYNHKGMKGSMHWAELCMGIRAHVWKQISMGWALRYKFKLSAQTDPNGNPWYVPGYGTYGSSTIGITYTVTYKLPF